MASAKEVNEFHRGSDVDSSREAQHHTIGMGPNQAAAGDHSHNGSDSPFLLEEVSITGVANPTTVAHLAVTLESIVQILVEHFGAIDDRA